MNARSHFAAAALAVLTTFSAPSLALANEGLQGRWAGPGTVILPSGAKEKARCRASFRQATGRSFTMEAVCATASLRVAQTARVQQIGTNRYSGEFFNSDFNLSGIINLTQSGNRLTAALRGGGGTAFFSLSR